MSALQKYCAYQQFHFGKARNIPSFHLLIMKWHQYYLSNCSNAEITTLILNWIAANRSDLNRNAIHLACLSSALKK